LKPKEAPGVIQIFFDDEDQQHMIHLLSKDENNLKHMMKSNN
jgi:hypothetical protein